MNTPKIDRRTQYTKKVLKTSLIELMTVKPIAKISITELCEVADLNRTTFYGHYADQFELLHDIENEILSELNAALEKFDFQVEVAENVQVLEHIFRYVSQNSATCRILLEEGGDIDFQKKVMMLAHRHVITDELQALPVDAETAELYYIFVINGSIGLLQSWLKNGMRKSPKELAEIVSELTANFSWQLKRP